MISEKDKQGIIATTAEDAAADICWWVEDMIIKRALTPEERNHLSIKAKYWFTLGSQKQHLISTRELNYMRARIAATITYTGTVPSQ